MTNEQRDVLRGYIFNREMSALAPDAVAHFLRKGFPKWKGIDNMTDAELLEETGCKTFEEFEKMVREQKGI